MDIQIAIAILFFIFLGIFLLINKKKLTIQKILGPVLYFAMYKTKLGLKAMNSLAKKFPRILKGLSYTGIVVGFLGMILISYELIKNFIMLFTQPKIAAQAVGLVLPFPVKGGFYVPFVYWILSIFILAVIHEFSHGVIARLNGIKIKSSGFAFLAVLIPILPAAFVEPDEKQLSKAKPSKQLAVYAAGPFSNILTAIFCMLIMIFAFSPVIGAMVQADGILVNGFTPDANGGFPGQDAGIVVGDIITSVDGISLVDQFDFSIALENKTPGDTVNIGTNSSVHSVILGENPSDNSKGFLGITIDQNTKTNQGFVDKYGKITADVILWFWGLFFWLYLLNLGIGLFNLVPLGPIDGGRMIKVVLHKYLPKKKADKVWIIISQIFLAIILANVLAGFFI